MNGCPAYSSEQVLQLLALKERTIQWLTEEKNRLQPRLEKITAALDLMQKLSNQAEDLKKFETLRLDGADPGRVPGRD